MVYRMLALIPDNEFVYDTPDFALDSDDENTAVLVGWGLLYKVDTTQVANALEVWEQGDWRFVTAHDERGCIISEERWDRLVADAFPNEEV